MVLVCAATGNVGTHVVAELRRGNARVRAFARDAGKVHDLCGDDIEVALGDFSEPDTIQRAVDGVECVLLASANHPSQTQHEMAVIDAASSAGVRRIVKLSTVGAEIGSPLGFWDWHGRIERYLGASQVPAVVLRSNFYMSNLLMSSDQIARSSKLFSAAGQAKIAMIDPRDVGAVAAVCLTQAGHEGQRYLLTGPEAITYADVAQRLSTLLGHPVELVNVTDEALRQALLEAGMPEWYAGNLVTLFELLREGAGSEVTDTVKALTGQPARSFDTFASDHSAVFTPTPA